MGISISIARIRTGLSRRVMGVTLIGKHKS
jgi:hypothetical protein